MRFSRPAGRRCQPPRVTGPIVGCRDEAGRCLDRRAPGGGAASGHGGALPRPAAVPAVPLRTYVLLLGGVVKREPVSAAIGRRRGCTATPSGRPDTRRRPGVQARTPHRPPSRDSRLRIMLVGRSANRRRARNPGPFIVSFFFLTHVVPDGSGGTARGGRNRRRWDGSRIGRMAPTPPAGPILNSGLYYFQVTSMEG